MTSTLAHGRRAALTAAPGPAPRRLAVWNVAALALVWVSCLIVVALWVAGGGAQSLLGARGLAEAVTTAGRLTGLVAANLLMLQVLLMARVPVFEHGFGRDGLVRAHRLVGMWSFWLLLAHAVLTTIGYALADGANPVAEAVTLVLDYPGMLMATVGTVLLILVVVTSARRARARIRHESWHLLHLYGYLGAGLAVPHMIWTGADLGSSTLATAYWWGLWGAAFAAALIWRVVVPLVASARARLTVRAVRAEGPDVVRVEVDGAAVPPVRPGQFLLWRFRDGAGWTRGHPFSIGPATSLAATGTEGLSLVARVVGDGTARLRSLRPGTRVLIEGPYGLFTGERRTRPGLLMLAAGAGVVPIVALLQAERWAPGEAVLVTREHDPALTPCAAQIGELVRERGLRWVALPGPRNRDGAPWLPASHAAWDGPGLLTHLAPDAPSDAYVCGAPAWTQAVLADLRAAGWPAAAVHSERFGI